VGLNNVGPSLHYDCCPSRVSGPGFRLISFNKFSKDFQFFVILKLTIKRLRLRKRALNH
jgi:hypothetical protein